MQRLTCSRGCSDIKRGGPLRFRNIHKHAAHMQTHAVADAANQKRQVLMAASANLIRRAK
jgi:hypothetical protein